MHADMQAAASFLDLIQVYVERMHLWASQLSERFETYDRSPAFARMILGGHFSVSCGFAIDRRTHRELTFGISITRDAQKWSIVASAEDEDTDRSIFYRSSPPFAVDSPDGFVEAMNSAFAFLADMALSSEVVAAFRAVQR
jgi:hypothetical protein